MRRCWGDGHVTAHTKRQPSRPNGHPTDNWTSVSRKRTSVEEGAVEPHASGPAPRVAAPATPTRVHRRGDSHSGARHRHVDVGLYDRVRRAASTIALS